MEKLYAETEIVVRYAETDQMGIVHHSNYPVWFEMGRTDFFRAIGFPYSLIESKGMLMPLTDMSCKFKYPARYEDVVVVQTRVSYMSHVKIGFRYQVYNKSDGKLLATGETNHGCTDGKLRPLAVERAFPELARYVRENCLTEDQ
jgi:acyl-CoA thioester hydrolase